MGEGPERGRVKIGKLIIKKYLVYLHIEFSSE